MDNIFSNFIEIGIKTAARIKDNLKDFNEIIEQLAKALNTVSNQNGTITSKREMTGELFKNIYTDYQILEYKIDELNLSMTLFKVSRQDEGYPIIIDYNDDSIYCNSKSEFIDAISAILSDGRIILRIKEALYKL